MSHKGELNIDFGSKWKNNFGDVAIENIPSKKSLPFRRCKNAASLRILPLQLLHCNLGLQFEQRNTT